MLKRILTASLALLLIFTAISNFAGVTMPNTVDFIGSYAFYKCDSLTDIYYHGTNAEWKAISNYDSSTALASATIHYDACEYTDWSVTAEATCTEAGSQARTCTVCGKTDTQSIKALGHSGEWIIDTEATCTEDGAKHRVCTVCEITENKVISAHGHSLMDELLIAPTCTTNGQKRSVCKNCDYKANAVYIIGALGHSIENGACTVCDIEIKVLKSEHPYGNYLNETYTATFEDASQLQIFFGHSTTLESNKDYLYIYDSNDNLIGKYTGYELSSQIITVNDTMVKINLKSNYQNKYKYYGFRAEISPIYFALGDLNGDSTYNAEDLTLLKTDLLSGAASKTGYLNENGILDVIDIIKLKKLIAGGE